MSDNDVPDSSTEDVERSENAPAEFTIDDLERVLREHQISRADAEILLGSIESGSSARLQGIIVEDGNVGMCHWLCSVKGHGPLPLNREVLERLIEQITNPGRPGFEG